MIFNPFKFALGNSIFNVYDLEKDYFGDIEEGEESISYLFELDSVQKILQVERAVVEDILENYGCKIYELIEFYEEYSEDTEEFSSLTPYVITIAAFKYLVLELASGPGQFPSAHTIVFALIGNCLMTNLDNTSSLATFFE